MYSLFLLFVFWNILSIIFHASIGSEILFLLARTTSHINIIATISSCLLKRMSKQRDKYRFIISMLNKIFDKSFIVSKLEHIHVCLLHNLFRLLFFLGCLFVCFVVCWFVGLCCHHVIIVAHPENMFKGTASFTRVYL